MTAAHQTGVPSCALPQRAKALHCSIAYCLARCKHGLATRYGHSR